jgi:signal transduction histidine kinase
MDPATKERLLNMGPGAVSWRLNKKDSGRLRVKDSLIRTSGVSMAISGKTGKVKTSQAVQAISIARETGAAFNKVFIGVGDGERGESSPFVQFLANNKTLNDSIPVRVVDSAYRDELVKSNKKIPYTILFKKYADNVARKADFEPDSSENIITSRFFVGYNTPYSYQAAFTDAGHFIMKKMSMQIGGSVFLLLFVMLSFVTVYRNLMAQQRLTTIKNDFISNITHELKTPIATVNVAIEALRNFGGLQSPERTKEYLDISASELQRLSLLVDKVLKLSMFENKQITLQKESFDLLQLIEEVMASMKLQFEKQKAVTTLESTGTNFMIDADRLHIASVIYNLLDNALKYSKEDTRISVQLTRHAEYFELRVADNGIGIPDAYQSRIFDQFFRVPGGDRHDTKGYGLGLSYVSHIIKQHQGFIEVESELGKGSTFIVKIPFAEIDVVHFDRGRRISKEKFGL